MIGGERVVLNGLVGSGYGQRRALVNAAMNHRVP
jgi:hypothetical protein